MFPAMPVQANKKERMLIKFFKKLDESNKETLLAFAEFLSKRGITEAIESDELPTVSSEPLEIVRPEKESVVKAIKRLSATYPMVDKENILHPISAVMTSHIMQGKAAPDAIDELQDLFLKEYNKISKED